MSIFERIRAKIREKKGFTLVELLVTVTIIGVLAAVVTVGVSGSASNAQIKANQGTYADVQSAVDSWLASNPTNAATDIVVGGTDLASTVAQWYTAGGTAANVPLNTVAGASGSYGAITFSQTTGAAQGLNTFFRLNAGSAVVCVLPKASAAAVNASSSTVFACHN